MIDVPKPDYAYDGALIGLVIIFAAVLSTAALLSAEFSWWLLLFIPFQMFLFTGLFITAHDAMHGLVAPLNPSLNRAIGLVAVGVYAAFSYKRLHTKHHEHHQSPGSPGEDPDFHDGEHPSFVRWYFHFLMQYVTWWQIVIMAIVFNVFEHAFGVPVYQLLLLWVMPSLLSTVQLFYFGTYLPHRFAEDLDAPHHATSNDYAPWLSFLTCYHFGYHEEHHRWPSVPWWRLPAVRRQRLITED